MTMGFRLSSINRRATAVAVASAFGLAGALVAVDAFALTQTADLTVSADVAAVCTISTSPLAFGSYNTVTGAAVNGTGVVTVTCTTGSTAHVTLGQGAHANTGSTDAIPLRRMSDGGTSFLSYQLFSDSNRTLLWGNTELTGVARTGTGAADALTVFGTINALQNVPAGSYSDTVVATVTF
jgi:spore coat protein U-like protein